VRLTIEFCKVDEGITSIFKTIVFFFIFLDEQDVVFFYLGVFIEGFILGVFPDSLENTVQNGVFEGLAVAGEIVVSDHPDLEPFKPFIAAVIGKSLAKIQDGQHSFQIIC